MGNKKIMWISNVMLPDVAEYMGKSSIKGGGWMVKSSKLIARENINLTILFPHYTSINIEISGIRYVSFKNNRNIRRIIDELNPDLVHVFGTEFKHSYEAIKYCNKKEIPALVHIQGFVSELSYLMDYKIPLSIKYGFTLRDFIKFDNVFLKKIKYKKRGSYEIKTIRISKYITGRTDWDRSIINSIKENDDYYYFHNYEMLRDEFYYSPKWNIKGTNKNQIFITQCSYPIKGLHTILYQFSRLSKKIKNLKIVISGRKINFNPTLKERLMETKYERYIRSEIKKYNLEHLFTFTGPLDPPEMIEYYLSSRIVLTPSLLENSPNSLTEALFLGVPTISSYTGGIPSIVKDIEGYEMYPIHNPELLYEKVYMLLREPKKLQELSANSLSFSENKFTWTELHKKNLEIYDNILEESDS